MDDERGQMDSTDRAADAADGRVARRRLATVGAVGAGALGLTGGGDVARAQPQPPPQTPLTATRETITVAAALA